MASEGTGETSNHAPFLDHSGKSVEEVTQSSSTVDHSIQCRGRSRWHRTRWVGVATTVREAIPLAQKMTRRADRASNPPPATSPGAGSFEWAPAQQRTSPSTPNGRAARHNKYRCDRTTTTAPASDGGATGCCPHRLPSSDMATDFHSPELGSANRRVAIRATSADGRPWSAEVVPCQGLLSTAELVRPATVVARRSAHHPWRATAPSRPAPHAARRGGR